MTRVVLRSPGGPDSLEVQTAEVPAPGPGQVVVRTEAAGVAFNDVTTRQGRNPGKLPEVLGFDAVGHVEAVGPGVSVVHVGDRVAALVGTGGYATHVLASADRIVPVPAELAAAEVSALTLNYLTAWQLLHRAARVRAGQSVLVLGAAGGVGSALCELAVLAGVTVYGTSGAGRRAAVEANGARWVPDRRDLPVCVDATFDAIGGPSLAESRRVTAPGGIVVSYGFSFAVDADHSRFGGLARQVAALLVARLTPGPRVRMFLIERGDAAAVREDLARLIDLLAQGRVRPAVTTMPLAQAADAHRRLESRQVTGKLVLVTGSRPTTVTQPFPDSRTDVP
jgi:NADPH:quinone reductase-like Zn-dependent oxidoreductase